MNPKNYEKFFELLDIILKLPLNEKDKFILVKALSDSFESGW